MKRLDRFVVAALAGLLAIVGAGMLVPASAGFPGADRSTPPGIVYREGVIGHSSSINPLTARTQVDRDLVALLFRGLVRNGPDGLLQADLARAWSMSPDGKTYTFLMRDDAYWEDGQPVTSADVVFTVKLLQEEGYDGPYGVSWQGIKVIADDRYVVRFTMSVPLAGFLNLATLPLLPQHVVKGVPVAELADSLFSYQPTGNGPFRLVEVDSSHAILQRVRSVVPADGLFGPVDPAAVTTPVAEAGLGGIEEIRLRFFDDAPAMVAQFRAGDLDAIGGLTTVNADAALERDGARLVDYPSASLTGVILNQRADHPEFRDANVRLGLLAAIDRQSILDGVLDGHGTVADVPIPRWSSAYDSSAVTTVGYSGTTAQSYLNTAGWQRGMAGWMLPKATSVYTFTLLAPDEATNPVANRAAVHVVEDWRALGLDVTLDAQPAAEYTQMLSKGLFSAAVVDFRVGLDPDLSPLLLSSQVVSGGSNVSGYQDQALDKLLIAARNAVTPEARQAAVAAVLQYVSANAPILPLCFRDYLFVVSDALQGLRTSQIGDASSRYWDVIDWRLASDG
jgi:peptide/nickel transport system substrate-binding protein